MAVERGEAGSKKRQDMVKQTLKTDYLTEWPKELVGSNFFFEKKNFFLKISM